MVRQAHHERNSSLPRILSFVEGRALRASAVRSLLDRYNQSIATGKFAQAAKTFKNSSTMITKGKDLTLANNFEFPACATADRSVAEPQKQFPFTKGEDA